MADEQGRGVSEEMMLPLLADHQLSRGPGKIVITNLSSSALLEEVAARHGGRVLRVPVGRQAAMDALAAYRPEQIAAAGEGTGAVMMPQFRFIYDGIASMLAVLTMMRERGRSLGQLLSEYPQYSILKGEVRLESPRVPALLVDLLAAYPDGRIDRTDGLRVSWPDRWFHVRVSHTEPIIRVICEQRGAPPQELFETLMDKARSYS
jgi:phosphomannomutase